MGGLAKKGGNFRREFLGKIFMMKSDVEFGISFWKVYEKEFWSLEENCWSLVISKRIFLTIITGFDTKNFLQFIRKTNKI